MTNASPLHRVKVPKAEFSGPTQGTQGVEVAPVPTRVIYPIREYVVGNSPLWSNTGYYQSLSFSIDDITSDFGDDIYERILLDPQPSSCLVALKAAILEDGVSMTARVQNESTEGYTQSKQMLEFCQNALEALKPKLSVVLWSLLDAIGYGNKVAEKVYIHEKTYTGKDQLVLDRLKVKPRQSVAFVTDIYDNHVGYLVKMPGAPWPTLTDFLMTDTMMANFLPPWKFACMTFRPKDSDPRGTSILRPAFDPWWTKQQLKPQFLQYLTQFASPGLVGIGPEDNTPIPMTDSKGNPIVDPATGFVQMVRPLDQLLNALLAFRNGTAVVVPHGGDVKAIEMVGDGAAFLNAFSRCDMEIAKTILAQTLATEQTDHQTRAASTVHQDVLGTLVRQAKSDVCAMIQDQVLKPLIAYNYGQDWERWCPIVSLGRTEDRDLAAMTNAVSQLMATGYLDPSQLPELDVRLGLPVRTSIEAAVSQMQKKAGTAMNNTGTGGTSGSENESGA